MKGECTLTYYDGSKYQGHIERGHFHGEGTFHWPDGSYYRGQWSKSVMHGKGFFQSDFTGKMSSSRATSLGK